MHLNRVGIILHLVIHSCPLKLQQYSEEMSTLLDFWAIPTLLDFRATLTLLDFEQPPLLVVLKPPLQSRRQSWRQHSNRLRFQMQRFGKVRYHSQGQDR